MSSLPLAAVTFDFDTDPAPAFKINATQVDLQLGILVDYANALKSRIDLITRSDDTIQDGLIRLRMLHAEVIAALASTTGWQPLVSAAVATTANVALTGEQTIDGVLTSASRVLVKNQTLPAENGVYTTAAGAWSRATDADTAAEIGYAAISVIGGLTNVGTAWVVTLAAASITLGVTGITWAQFGSALANVSARRVMVRVATATALTVAAPGASIDGIAMVAGERVLLTAQAVPAQNGIWQWNGAAVPMTRTTDYPAGGTSQAFIDLEVSAREGSLYQGFTWRLATSGAIVIDTTATTWLLVASTMGFRLPARVAAVANVTIATPGAAIDGITLAVNDRVLLTAQSTASQNGIWIFQGAAAPMTRPADWTSIATPQALYGVVLEVVDGSVYSGSLWRCSTTGMVTIGTTSTAFAMIGLPTLSEESVTQVRAVAVANTTIATPGATIDSVTMVAGDRVLLTAQSTASQNGLWVWNGAATPMTRPVDYSSLLPARAFLNLQVLTREGAVYQGTTWQITTSGIIAVDTTTTAWSQVAQAFKPWQTVVRLVAVANITIATPGASIDSTAVVAGDRVLLTAQSTASQNGIWIWNGAASAMTRPVDWAAALGAQQWRDTLVAVRDGTLYAGTSWRCVTSGMVTIDAAGTVWAQITPGAINRPAVVGTSRNLVIAPNSGIPLTKVDITADDVVLMASATLAYVASTVSLVGVDFNVTGANGLDTGVRSANTWYYALVIFNPSTGTVAGLLSISATNPTMPSGYTYKAMLGAVRIDAGSAILGFIQRGKVVEAVPVTTSISATAPGAGNTYQTLSMAAQVPPIASVAKTQILGTILSGDAAFGIAADNSATGEAYSLFRTLAAAVGGFSGCFTARVAMSTAQTISWKSSSTGATNTIKVVGWEYA